MITHKTTIWVISLSCIIGCLLVWLVFAPQSIINLGDRTLFPGILLLLGFLPLHPLYRLAKRWPRMRIGIVMVGMCLLLTILLATTHYLMHIEGPWVDGMLDTLEAFFFLSCMVLGWQGARQNSRK